MTKDTLKKLGYKLTPPRLALIEIFHTSKKPLTIKDITSSKKYPTLEKVNEATIYRIITLFKKIGFIKEVYLGGNITHYEKTDDSHSHHHHIVCTSCKTITDIHSCYPPSFTKKILQNNKSFASITGHSMEFFGLCKQCCLKH